MDVLGLIHNSTEKGFDSSFHSVSSESTTSLPRERSGNFRTLFKTNEQSQVWPVPPKSDPILSTIEYKTAPLLQSISPRSLSTHKSILCSLQLTDDLPLLSQCFPMLSNAFLIHSLFQDIHHTSIACTEVQHEFIHSLLYKKAMRATQPILHSLEFHNISIIGLEFSLDQSYILSSFCLIMYNLGKDAFIDELITSNPSMFDMALLVNGTTSIVCERIHVTLSTMKKVRKFRGIIGMVDADLSSWIKEEADKLNQGFWKVMKQRKSDTNESTLPSLSDTHALVHKLLWLAERCNHPSYKNILLLSKFTGQLLQAVTVQSGASKRSLFS